MNKQKFNFKKTFIGDKEFYAMVMAVAVPIMIQNGISNFVSLLDNIMVGRVGTEQMSGVSIVNQLNFVYFLMLFGGMSGIGIFTAQFFGNKDQESIRHTFRFKLYVGLALTVIAYIAFIAFGPQLINFYLNESADGGDLAATLHYAKGYQNIILFMFPAVLLSNVYASTMRECGETKIPMMASVIAVFLNLILNYLLIYGKLGLPAMGVNGAALATVISKYTEAGIVIIWTHTHPKKCEYIKGMYASLHVPAALMKRLVVKGFPLLVNETLWSVGQSMLLQCYSLRGLNVIVAFNISNTICDFFNIVFLAMGDAVTIIVGQKLGAGELDDAKDTDNKIIFFSVCLSVITGILMAIASFYFPEIYKTNAEAKQLATGIILANCAFMPVNAFNHAAYFTLRSGGKTVITFLFDSCFTIGVHLPIAFCLSRFTTLPAIIIFIAVLSAGYVQAIIGFVLVKSNYWIQDLTKTA